MKYVGSKRRIADDILAIVLDGRTTETYVEPFVGGCNVIEKVLGSRIGNDINHYLIAMYRALVDGWNPPASVSEEEYRLINTYRDSYPDHLVAFVGFNCSFGSKWWGGYARGATRNYAATAREQLFEQVPKLRGINFQSTYYDELIIPDNSIIYCDPPYAETLGYGSDFCHIGFWQWVRNMSHKHKVYVSEVTAPPDFKILDTFTIHKLIKTNSYSDAQTEHLYAYAG